MSRLKRSLGDVQVNNEHLPKNGDEGCKHLWRQRGERKNGGDDRNDFCDDFCDGRRRLVASNSAGSTGTRPKCVIPASRDSYPNSDCFVVFGVSLLFSPPLLDVLARTFHRRHRRRVASPCLLSATIRPPSSLFSFYYK